MWRLESKELFILFYAGTIRGAVAFALILFLNGTKEDEKTN